MELGLVFVLGVGTGGALAVALGWLMLKTANQPSPVVAKRPAPKVVPFPPSRL